MPYSRICFCFVIKKKINQHHPPIVKKEKMKKERTNRINEKERGRANSYETFWLIDLVLFMFYTQRRRKFVKGGLWIPTWASRKHINWVEAANFGFFHNPFNTIIIRIFLFYLFTSVRTRFSDEPKSIGFTRKRPRQYDL